MIRGLYYRVNPDINVNFNTPITYTIFSQESLRIAQIRFITSYYDVFTAKRGDLLRYNIDNYKQITYISRAIYEL